MECIFIGSVCPSADTPVIESLFERQIKLGNKATFACET